MRPHTTQPARGMRRVRAWYAGGSRGQARSIHLHHCWLGQLYGIVVPESTVLAGQYGGSEGKQEAKRTGLAAHKGRALGMTQKRSGHELHMPSINHVKAVGSLPSLPRS